MGVTAFQFVTVERGKLSAHLTESLFSLVHLPAQFAHCRLLGTRWTLDLRGLRKGRKRCHAASLSARIAAASIL